MGLIRVLAGLVAGLLLGLAGSSPLAQEGEKREAIFAGGCFWCMQPPYDALEGVLETEAGYIGGHVEDPTYQQVVAGGTGHAEAVRVVYDPDVVTYEELLAVFWRNIDPLDDGGQFCDRGDQYRSAIFARGSEQRAAAEASRAELAASDRFDQPLVTEILDAQTFYRAEEYHQDYYKKNPLRYRLYRMNCGRDRRLNALWGD
jgi:peptide-methionine (S)-S-oxide reductase